MNFPFIATLSYLINKNNQVLLQYKARGFGMGKWNGPGGKKHQDESIEESARREVKEETDIVMKDIKKAGELEFIFVDNEKDNFLTHVFICRDFDGLPKDSDEGKLKWFKIDELPLNEMWDDDQYWLRPLLNGDFQHKRFYFDKKGKVIKYEEL